MGKVNCGWIIIFSSIWLLSWAYLIWCYSLLPGLFDSHTSTAPVTRHGYCFTSGNSRQSGDTILDREARRSSEIKGKKNTMPIKMVDADTTNFNEVMEKFQAEAPKYKANFILFLADKDPSTGLSWCPDCVRAEAVIYEKLESCGDDVAMVRAYVGDRPTWRNPHHPWRVDKRFQLKGVPTLALWDWRQEAVKGRLEDHEAHIGTKIEALFHS